MSDSRVFRPAIGVGVLVWRDQQLLLGKRISKDQNYCWQFPGGHLESSESVIDCARREVLEETSLKIKGLRHLGFTDKPFVVAQRQYITLLVSCVYESGNAQTLEPDKCEAWQWFDYPQLPAPLFEPIKIFMSQQDDLYALHNASQILPDTPSVERK
jgi:8-oxo-dGTP diphosphatase